jgi:hypothetical protein
MRRKRSLGQVEDPRGRVDVALYRLAESGLARLEQEQNLVGLRENVLPILEDWISRNLPAENLIPREIQAVLKICQLNQRRGISDGHQ